ncbi:MULTISPECIES: TIGR02221 family CRISPR-associated protein, partial [unclassified Halorhodospira]|uniref:TIGR02221 family CRISPR-associated protein n=1 Tax=unclassified Halorhodospira TaxID=2626748 RepID=UPI001EE91ECB
MHTLVSFLGRTRRPEQGYERVAYCFPDGTRQEGIAFIGHGIAAHTRPDRLVILGTAGSMWDQLLADYPSAQLPEESDLALPDSVDRQATSAEQLDELAQALTQAAGREVILRLIPETPGMDETWQILHTLAEVTADTDRLTLDITHGFRHLPMVALMAALYRQTLTPDLEVDGLWYAQLASGGQEAEMHDIAGILALADWMEAIQRGRTTGDLSAVASLLQADAPQIAEDLAQGSFLETVHQGQHARSRYRRVRQALRETDLPGPGGLFQPLLEAQTAWVEGQRLYLRQAEHARNALARQDYLRAALYGYEAFITQRVYQRDGAQWINDREQREAAREAFIRNCKGRSRKGSRCQ